MDHLLSKKKKKSKNLLAQIELKCAKKKVSYTWTDVNNWSTVMLSLNPWDCECNRRSGSNLAGQIAPGAVGGAQCGITGSLSANSVYNIFKYLLNLAWKKDYK